MPCIIPAVRRAGQARRVTLDLTGRAKDFLAKEGFDPVYGARPLKRVIQKALQDPLAELLLGGTLRDGETLAVSAGDDGLVLGDRARGATQGASATLH